MTQFLPSKTSFVPFLAVGVALLLLGYTLSKTVPGGLPVLRASGQPKAQDSSSTGADLQPGTPAGENKEGTAPPGPGVEQGHGAVARQVRRPPAKPRPAAECPVQYQRMTMEQVQSKLHSKDYGRLTYLFGNHDRPGGCRHCNRTEGWAQFCQFKSSGPICPSWALREFLASWIQRGYELPVTLTPCDLWKHLHGRTLMLIGDSMMLDFYKGMHCFMMEMWASLGPGSWDLEVPLTEDKDLEKELTPDWLLPKCVPLLGGATRICYVRTDRGDTLVNSILPLLLKHKVVDSSDLLVVNFGLHHGPQEYPTLLSNFRDYAAQHGAELPYLFWQQVSSQHFATTGGEYGGGKPPFECKPILNFTVEGNGTLLLQPGTSDTVGTMAGQWRNKLANQEMAAAGIPIIPSFNETVPMWGAHRNNGKGHECTHYCHPSAPQLWVVSLYRALEEAGV